eukprot:g19566.t1
MRDFIASTDPLVVRSDRQGYRILYGDMKLVGDTIMVTNVQPCDYRDARPTLVGQKAPNLKNKSKKQLQALCGDRADAKIDSATQLMADAFQNLSQRRMFFDPWAVKMQRSRLISRLAARSREADRLKRRTERRRIRDGVRGISADDEEAGDGDMVVESAEAAAETARQERLRRSFEDTRSALLQMAQKKLGTYEIGGFDIKAILEYTPDDNQRSVGSGAALKAVQNKPAREVPSMADVEIKALQRQYTRFTAGIAEAIDQHIRYHKQFKNSMAQIDELLQIDAALAPKFEIRRALDVASLDLMGVSANDYHGTGAVRGDHDEGSDDGEDDRNKAEDKMDEFFVGDETGRE